MRYCFNGIAREKVIRLDGDNGIRCKLRIFTLAEVYDADEAFVTGTFGGLTPVQSIDGRSFSVERTWTRKLSHIYETEIGMAYKGGSST